MQPLFPPTCAQICAHPAIKAAKKCKKAMELVNQQQYSEAEGLLKNALQILHKKGVPMVKAKVLNSLGIMYLQQKKMHQAERFFESSMRIVEAQIGKENWLYGRIAENRQRSLAA